MQKLLYIVVHLLFWTTFAALSWMSIGTNPGETAFIVEHPSATVLLTSWALVNFYCFYFYVQPRWLDSRRLVTYFFISIGFSLFSSLFFVGVFWLLFDSFRPFAIIKFLEGIGGTFMISQCGSLLKGFVSWNDGLQQKTELENRSLKNELSMLKAQLSPHFLFNTLNNIDALIYKSQDEASAMLIRLSELLRYMLYESETKEVSIKKELEYLQRLTDLQKLRFQEPDFIQFSIRNGNPELKIAPLLLLPFVENAFKFVSSAHEVPGIKINIDVGDNHIHFRCENYFRVSSDDSIYKTGGIGLTNVQRRLELLYPDKFKLSIIKKEHKFTVDLHLTSV